jgi:hypothetical protein
MLVRLKPNIRLRGLRENEIYVVIEILAKEEPDFDTGSTLMYRVLTGPFGYKDAHIFDVIKEHPSDWVTVNYEGSQATLPLAFTTADFWSDYFNDKEWAIQVFNTTVENLFKQLEFDPRDQRMK